MWMDIFDCIVALLGITYVLLNCYNKTKSELLLSVAELIAAAEETGLTGAEKMAGVVAVLREKVPKFLRKVLNEKQLEMVTQWIFNWMRRYALAYMNALQKDNKEDANEQMNAVLVEAATDLLLELMNMTEDALLDMAVKKGIDLNGAETKDDVVRALVVSVLESA